MTVYATATINVTDPEALGRYREGAGAALEKHKGTNFAASMEPQILEGDGPAPDVAVILAFPDREHALAWINDPAIADVHDARRAGGITKIILM